VAWGKEIGACLRRSKGRYFPRRPARGRRCFIAVQLRPEEKWPRRLDERAPETTFGKISAAIASGEADHLSAPAYDVWMMAMHLQKTRD
jgi:hypothetical protein